MTPRRTLPNRREHRVFEFDCDGLHYRCAFGVFPDGSLAELFLSCAKPGSAAAVVAQDAAIIMSLALQYGTPLGPVRHALTRLSDGAAAGPLGRALDIIDAEFYAR